MIRDKRIPKILFIFTASLAAFLTSLPLASQQASQFTNGPASEGRPVTPAGELLIDAATKLPAVGSLPVAFVRSPDKEAKDGGGRYLLSINSGYGIQIDAQTNDAQESVSVIDLSAQPAPQVIQNIYFPSPQSAQVGAVFSPRPAADGLYTLYVSGGFENKIWMFRFQAGAPQPVSPPSNGPSTKVTAPFVSVKEMAATAASPRINDNQAMVYPLGLDLSADGNTLFTANDLGNSLGVISNLRRKPRLASIDLGSGAADRCSYPYGVAAWNAPGGRRTQKVFVSCWASASLAVVDMANPGNRVTFVPTGKNPTAMIWNSARTRLYVVNSDDDSVTVIDPRAERVVETISVRLSKDSLRGGSPEGLALSADGATLYVADAHSNAVAVVGLSSAARGIQTRKEITRDEDDGPAKNSGGERELRSAVRGFIPTGQYPSAIAVADGSLIVANGKGTGFENSSLVANESGRAPNTANERFPFGTGRTHQGGEYDVAMIAGTFSQIAEPSARTLADYTAQVMRNDGLMGAPDVHLFAGPSPIRHVIYIIRENRTYDEIFGDVTHSGDGSQADGDPALAIFGDGAAAQRPGGTPQDITPNAHALAQRFGLFDRFFVNSEASPDGHNWTDAAFSSDFVDKGFRWNYSRRGRSYDFQGTNGEPDIWPRKDAPPILPVPATPDQIAQLIRHYVPYKNGSRDAGEPGTLYLWDSAARAGISYRSNGEGVVTISQAQIDAFNANRARTYPDLTPTVISFALKKALEGHISTAHREFDLYTPDAMTTESYRAAKDSRQAGEALISPSNHDPQFRGYSRISAWLSEFRGYVSVLEKTRHDTLPAFNIVYLPNDHTSGMNPGMPTPQFYISDNDYALGLLVQELSSSPYWKDTAIFVLEDDAQNGPDHVDAHRSPALVISAYNRRGPLMHDYHSTVSLIRTMELLLGMPPMNQLDASASPMDIFQSTPDFTPYRAVLPQVADNNLITQPAKKTETAAYIHRSLQQDFDSPDLADPAALNRIIWYSVRGGEAYPDPNRLPAFDALRTGEAEKADEQEEAEQIDRAIKKLLAAHARTAGPRTTPRD
ncbi:MAG: bifunctional YncE family protein/alkaline phosphatase family protein [Candidatus Acidiferrales bacterium]